MPLALTNRKSRALLAFLALSETGRETRERLLGLLWSEADPARARGSLRQAVYEIRTSLEAAGWYGFAADNLTVRIEHTDVDSDTHDVLEEIALGRVHSLLADRQRPAETLLEDLASVDPAFESWVTARREVLARHLCRELEGMLEAAGSGRAAKDAAAALLNLDPTHEKAARALMRAHAADGNVGSALDIYKRLWDLLDAEFDVEPAEETQRLVAEIKLAEGKPGGSMALPTQVRIFSSPAIGTSPDDRSSSGLQRVQPHQRVQPQQRVIVAVGKFELASDQAKHGYIFQAFRRELIAQLVRFREWVVRDLDFGAGAPVPGSSEYVIEATAIEQRNTARLVVTLKHLETGDYLWSERLPLDLGSWYESIQDIVRRLSSQLNVYLSAGRLATLMQKPSSNLRAYDMWLKAQTRLFHWSPEEGHAAEELLKRIIAEVPDFAPAYASLASFSGNVHFYHPGFMRTVERHRAAREYADQAVRLDPIDSRAHLSLGWADAFLEGYDSAASHHALALELNDSDPWILTSTALSSVFVGDGTRARELSEKASLASPSPSPSQMGYRAQVAYAIEDYEEAVRSIQHATAVHFGGWRAASLAQKGDLAEARTALDAFFGRVRERWYGRGPASPATITQWFLHLHPIRHRDTWSRLRDGLEKAGAPRVDVPFFG